MAEPLPQDVLRRAQVAAHPIITQALPRVFDAYAEARVEARTKSHTENTRDIVMSADEQRIAEDVLRTYSSAQYGDPDAAQAFHRELKQLKAENLPPEMKTNILGYLLYHGALRPEQSGKNLIAGVLGTFPEARDIKFLTSSGPDLAGLPDFLRKGMVSGVGPHYDVKPYSETGIEEILNRASHIEQANKPKSPSVAKSHPRS